MSAKVKLISLISAFMLVLGIIVIGVLAVSQQTLRMSGSVNFNVDDKSLYVKQVRIKQDNGSEPEPVIGFLPGYINGDFVMNIGNYSGDDANTIGSFALYFDIINTTAYDWFVSDVSLSSTLQSQNVSVTYSGEIDAGSSTEITDTTPLSGTIILTISSPNATLIDLSGITVTLEAILPTPATSFTFSYSDTDHTASITKFVGSETEVIIPSTVENKGITYTVTSIGDNAFQGCSSLTSITIPEGVTSIGDNAFPDCSSLTSITIPDSVTSIGSAAFSRCRSLTSITIPEGVTSIGDNAFMNCSSLTSITIPEGVTSIGEDVFYGCRSLTSITIPEGVTSIDRFAFDACYALAEVYNYSPSITVKLGEISFSNNGGLGQYAKVVYNAGDSKPETRITVVDNMQYYSDGEDFIALAPAVARGTLTEVSLDSRTTEINLCAFYGCDSLTSIIIPERVTSIGDRAFQNCSNLTSITIPEGVTSIEDSTFLYCSSLTSITIPEGVTSIGEDVFYGCDSLTSITINATTPPTLASNAIPSNVTNIYVPAESVEAYKKANGWKSYSSKISAIVNN